MVIPRVFPTEDQNRAFYNLMSSPAYEKAACTLTDRGSLMVRVDGEHEFIIDRDGTVVPMFYEEAR